MATDAGAGEQSLSSDVLNLAADKARRYVRDIPERRVSPSEAALTALSELMEPFPSLPSDPCEVITRLDQIGSAATVATTGGRYFGFVNGGMVPAALAANWLAAAWNQNAACLPSLRNWRKLSSVGFVRHLDCRRTVRGAWLPARRWRISRRLSRHVTRCLRAQGGMSPLTGCLGPRPSTWLQARKSMLRY